MLFSSIVFLFYFLPITLLGYYCLPKIFRNGFLLLMSILFYAWCGTGFAALLVLSVLINFLIAKQIQRSETTAKRWLVSGIVLNVCLLFVFKYLHFFAQLFITHKTDETDDFLKLTLPLGISFYTFHQLSMLRDLYRDRNLPKVTLVNMSLYVTLFPQLVAGPIVRYKDIIHQIRQRNESTDLFYSGIQRFLIGLSKKVIIANTCASLADAVFAEHASILSPGAAWLGIIAYTLQIYFDFSGYSDMAIGLGRMFGFSILENFNLPYIATSIKEFWRRWHISLSTWFRDYVYIPLGGNQKGPVRTYVNLMLVFLLTGFWHGASWSFIFWGFFHGVFLLIERLGFDKRLERFPSLIGWLYTLLVVMIGWVFFRVEAFGDAVLFVQRMFSFTEGGVLGIRYFLNNEYSIVLLIAVFLSCFSTQWLAKQPVWVKWNRSGWMELGKNTFYLGAFVYSVMILSSSSYNPFIYFNF